MKILDLTGKEKGDRKLPVQFTEQVREDIVKKAVLALQANSRHPYGASPEAGMRASAELSRRRRKYRGSYGFGISRVPRKILSRRGRRLNWVGAVAPGTVGGRRAHPPKPYKIWDKKVNTKERKKAIRSALSATLMKELVEKRGHMPPENYPFIIDNQIQELDKTKKVIDVLLKFGLKKELDRINGRKTRAGAGKRRGRRYRSKTGPLLIVGDDCKLTKGSVNIPGVEVIKVNALNAEMLAPGCSIGRLTLLTESAVEKIEKEKLFV